jgi:tetratricopeptide (TPR) repeat protein
MGDYYIDSGKVGDRNKNTNKYSDDAELLVRTLAKENDPHMISRYTFYCAQSYRDCKNTDKAIEYYLKTLEVGLWDQEKYCACINLGNLYLSEGKDLLAIKYYLKSDQYDKQRIEGIVLACQHFLNNDLEFLIVNIYKSNKNYNKNINGKLFVHTHLYNNYLEFFYVVSVVKLQLQTEYENAYKLCKKVLLDSETKNELIIEKLLVCCDEFKDSIKNDKDTLDLCYYIQNKVTIYKNLQEKLKNVITILIENNMSSFTKVKNLNLKSSDKKNILMHIHAKNLSNVKNTLYSICNTWLDIDKIDFFYMTCENFSKKEKDSIQKLFPYFQYNFNGCECPFEKEYSHVLKIDNDTIYHNKLEYIHLLLSKKNNNWNK